jgi:hypothetical protein
VLELTAEEIRRACGVVGRRRRSGFWPSLRRHFAPRLFEASNMWSFPLTTAMFRLEAFDQLGGLDEQFWYCHENNDFALRAISAGWSVGRAGTAFVNHRRFVFRAAGSAGDGLAINRRGHDEGMERWIRKWGKPYGEIFAERQRSVVASRRPSPMTGAG